MLDGVVLQDGHLHGYPDAVVGAEGGAFGSEPVAVNIGLDGVFGEVEVQAGHLLAHHIHVALQHCGLEVFIARGGRLANKHVAHGVLQCFEAELVAEIYEKGAHLLLLVGGAGNLIDLCKAVKDGFGLEGG